MYAISILSSGSSDHNCLTQECKPPNNVKLLPSLYLVRNVSKPLNTTGSIVIVQICLQLNPCVLYSMSHRCKKAFKASGDVPLKFVLGVNFVSDRVSADSDVHLHDTRTVDSIPALNEVLWQASWPCIHTCGHRAYSTGMSCAADQGAQHPCSTQRRPRAYQSVKRCSRLWASPRSFCTFLRR